jgi:hypothetical protein
MAMVVMTVFMAWPCERAEPPAEPPGAPSGTKDTANTSPSTTRSRARRPSTKAQPTTASRPRSARAQTQEPPNHKTQRTSDQKERDAPKTEAPRPRTPRAAARPPRRTSDRRGIDWGSRGWRALQTPTGYHLCLVCLEDLPIHEPNPRNKQRGLWHAWTGE